MATPRFTIGLGRLLAATVFFAMAILVASYDRKPVDLRRLLPFDFLAVPLLGVTIGAGMGVLCDRIKTGIFVGLALALPFLAVMEGLAVLQSAFR